MLVGGDGYVRGRCCELSVVVEAKRAFRLVVQFADSRSVSQRSETEQCSYSR